MIMETEIRPLTREEQLEVMIGIIETERFQLGLTLDMLTTELENRRKTKNLTLERKKENGK